MAPVVARRHAVCRRAARALAQEIDLRRRARQLDAVVAEAPRRLQPERRAVEGGGALEIVDVDVDAGAPSSALLAAGARRRRGRCRAPSATSRLRRAPRIDLAPRLVRRRRRPAPRARPTRRADTRAPAHPPPRAPRRARQRRRAARHRRQLARQRRRRARGLRRAGLPSHQPPYSRHTLRTMNSGSS